MPGNVVLAGGSGTFHATLETVGMQTITATDIAKTAITGATNSIKVTAGATSLSVSAASLATAGKTFNFTVTALDVLGKPVTNYPGTLTFTSTDGQAVLPSNSQFTSGTGSASFSMMFQTAGNQTITTTDVANPSHRHFNINPCIPSSFWLHANWQHDERSRVAHGHLAERRESACGWGRCIGES